METRVGETDRFVTVRDGRFELGGRPLVLAGANNYYLGYKSRYMVDDVLDAARAMGLNVLRTWGFIDRGSLDGAVRDVDSDAAERGVYYQYWDPDAGAPAYNDGSDGLEKLDYAVAAAGRRGLQLIVALVNNWKDFGGMGQYLAWYGLTRHDLFYTRAELRKAYREWVRHLLERTNTLTGVRYKDDPTILAWELANEPRCQSPQGPAPLVSWAEEMSAWVKQHDSRHLVAVGDEGFFHRPGTSDSLHDGTEGGDFDAFLRIPTIDFGTFHLYPGHWGRDPAWGKTWIEEHLAAGHEVGKPVVLEEYGIREASERGAVYSSWHETIERRGGGGALVWMLAGRQDDGEVYPDYDDYTLYSDAAASAVSRHAARAVHS